MIKYTIDLGRPLEYYSWYDVSSITYSARSYKIETDTLDDHLITIF